MAMSPGATSCRTSRFPLPDAGENRTSLKADETLGRYRLIECIGEGGMGAVWRAHDTKLDREVAIKLLLDRTLVDDSARERFHREALALSRISHPGVATVYDFGTSEGQDYLVMEYVPGGTLEQRVDSGPLPFKDIVRLGASVADAIANAHQHGVLHRDLKPGNIVLTAAGDPKILDFGLAVLLSGTRTTRVTQTGVVVGSLPYMAPEQIFGEADDVRTDVYALGVILFEMATGQRPFVRERPEALMFSILNDAHPTVRSLRADAPDELDRLVARCLQKEPAHRPQAAEVGDALRTLDTESSFQGTPARGKEHIHAIAVLPFRNVSKDPSQDYFADGMTESVISDLAQIHGLRVISRTSAIRYKDTELTVPQIARELNVDAVLEGSAHFAGDRVRMSVQLVSARNDETLWADRYERDLEDVFGLQNELAKRVTNEIQIQLSPDEQTKLTARRPVNPEAHIEFLKSRHSFFDGSPEAVELGVRHAMRALELDPDSALAWSALADCYIVQATRGMASPGEVVPKAIKAAERALEIDANLADAHASIGVIQSHSGDLPGGLTSLQKAIELNPGHAYAHKFLGRVLYSYELHAEAISAMHKSASLDPLSMMIHTGVGDAYYFARQYEMAVLHYEKSIELDSRFDGAHTDLARALEALGRFDEARAEYEEGRRLSGGIAGPSFGLAHLEAAAGNKEEARRMLAELTAERAERVVSAWGIMALHASLGDVDDAFKWLDIAFDENASGLILLRVHPRLDPIRNDPRYPPLVHRAGLDTKPI